MTSTQPFSEHRVLIVGAGQPPGADLARDLANDGARVVALDLKGTGLRTLASGCAGRIEPLAMSDLDRAAFARLGSAWGSASLNVVVNLLPLRSPRDINGQMRVLAALLRATARGLIAGRGRLVNVVGEPADPLDLPAVAMTGAFKTVQSNLNRAMSRRGLHVHLVAAPAGRPEPVLPLLRFLAGAQAQEVTVDALR